MKCAYCPTIADQMPTVSEFFGLGFTAQPDLGVCEECQKRPATNWHKGRMRIHPVPSPRQQSKSVSRAAQIKDTTRRQPSSDSDPLYGAQDPLPQRPTATSRSSTTTVE